MEFKRLSYKHKNNKFLYYFINYMRLLIPVTFFQFRLGRKLALRNSFDNEVIKQRVNYYNKLENHVDLSSAAKKLSDLKRKHGTKTYFFDLYEYSRFFNQNLRAESIAALECVDYVAINKWPTAVQTLRLLKPHYYVKGQEFEKKVAKQSAFYSIIGWV